MDKAQKIEEMETSLREITKELGSLKAEYIREEKLKHMKDKLYLEIVNDELHFKYKQVTLINIRKSGCIDYQENLQARLAFTEWISFGATVDDSSCTWKGRLYHLHDTGSSARCSSETPPGANWSKSPIFCISECYGSKSCIDPNIKVVPHNKRAIVHY